MTNDPNNQGDPTANGHPPQASTATAQPGASYPGYPPQGYPPGVYPAPAMSPQGYPAAVRGPYEHPMAGYPMLQPAPVNVAVQNTMNTTAGGNGLVRKSNRSRTTAAICALLLGGIGMHKFYLGRTGLGILYLVFCWTLIPAGIAFIEFLVICLMSDHDFDLKYNVPSPLDGRHPMYRWEVKIIPITALIFKGLIGICITSVIISYWPTFGFLISLCAGAGVAVGILGKRGKLPLNISAKHMILLGIMSMWSFILSIGAIQVARDAQHAREQEQHLAAESQRRAAESQRHAATLREQLRHDAPQHIAMAHIAMQQSRVYITSGRLSDALTQIESANTTLQPVSQLTPMPPGVREISEEIFSTMVEVHMAMARSTLEQARVHLAAEHFAEAVTVASGEEAALADLARLTQLPPSLQTLAQQISSIAVEGRKIQTAQNTIREAMSRVSTDPGEDLMAYDAQLEQIAHALAENLSGANERLLREIKRTTQAIDLRRRSIRGRIERARRGPPWMTAVARLTQDQTSLKPTKVDKEDPVENSFSYAVPGIQGEVSLGVIRNRKDAWVISFDDDRQLTPSDMRTLTKLFTYTHPWDIRAPWDTRAVSHDWYVVDTGPLRGSFLKTNTPDTIFAIYSRPYIELPSSLIMYAEGIRAWLQAHPRQ